MSACDLCPPTILYKCYCVRLQRASRALASARKPSLTVEQAKEEPKLNAFVFEQSSMPFLIETQEVKWCA